MLPVLLSGLTQADVYGAGFECLTEDLGEVLGLFDELIQEPALPEEKLALYKSQVCARCIPISAMSLVLLSFERQVSCSKQIKCIGQCKLEMWVCVVHCFPP